MNTTSFVIISARISALALGIGAVSISCFAAYAAAASVDGGYLTVAAPLVALSAAALPAYAEVAIHHRQWTRLACILAVWTLCAATVFFAAVERTHLAKGEGEAQRAAMHTAADRAKADLVDAKTAATTATTAANKVRGKDTPRAKVLLASEAEALARVEQAKAVLIASEGRAVTESEIKAPDWLLPLSLDLVGMVLISAAFGLGRHDASTSAQHKAPAPVIAAEPALTKRQIAARKGVETRRKNQMIRAKARVTGPKLAVSR